MKIRGRYTLPQNETLYEQEQQTMSPEEIAYYQQQEEILRQKALEGQRRLQEEEEEDDEISYRDVPVQRAIEIKRKPTPKGYFETVIGGIPVDLHALEDYLVTTSPFAIKTLMRYNNAEMIEDIKNYSTKT